MEKVIVWGTGLYFEQLCERGCLKNYDIIAFCDNDISKHGNIFHGKTIIAPNEIKNYEFDAIYIASELYCDEIKTQIINEKIASESKVLSFVVNKDKYEGELAFWKATYKKEGNHFSNELYRKRMLDIADEKDDSFWMGKVVADFGCGPRGSLQWTKTPSVKIGIDVLAERYLKCFGDEIVKHEMIYVTCSEDKIPVPDNYVDYLLTINSLDHVNNLDNMVGELLRILKPGGVLLGSFNLNEPCTECEPQTLNEDILQEKLLKYFEVQVYKMAYKGINSTYENMNNNNLVNKSDGNEAVLWVRAVKK